MVGHQGRTNQHYIKWLQMPRRSKEKPLPLDPRIVSSFHEAVLNGDIAEVNRQLTSTPRLANSKDTQELTPLMKAVSSVSLPWQTQVQLIDRLMNGGASLATRGLDRCHVLLLACKMGAATEVIDCLRSWNSKRGRQEAFTWNHCNTDKDGALVLAARSGSLKLVSHLLALDEIDLSECYSNAPIKVVDAAIKTSNEQLLLTVLGNQTFKENIDDFDKDDYDHDEDEYYDSDEEYYSGLGRRNRCIRVDECVKEAYERNMFDAVREMSSLNNWMVPVQIWSCWRKTRKQSAATVSLKDPKPNAAIEAIARKAQGDLVHKHNPALLPLLIARARYTDTDTDRDDSNTATDSILGLPDIAFHLVVEFCFIVSPDKLQKKVEDKLYFQKNSEWCCDCEG